MEKIFEDYFSEIQTDMVDICLEYVDDRAETIYIYCSFEGGVQSCNFFYKVNGKVVKKSRLNDVIADGQEEYDVAANSLDADYRYDIIYSNHKNKMADDILEEWFESEKNKEKRGRSLWRKKKDSGIIGNNLLISRDVAFAPGIETKEASPLYKNL